MCGGGAKIPNKGEGIVEFQNAEVGMPIMPTHGVACDWEAEITYGADRGHVTDLNNGKQTQFIMRDGVCFIEMKVPKSAVQEPPAPHPTTRIKKDFQGRA